MKITKMGTVQKDIEYVGSCLTCGCQFECRQDDLMWEQGHYEPEIDYYSFWRHKPVFKQVWVGERPFVYCPNCHHQVRHHLKRKCDC